MIEAQQAAVQAVTTVSNEQRSPSTAKNENPRTEAAGVMIDL